MKKENAPNAPKVTVIIPLYNSAAYIMPLLQELLSFKITSEILLINDGSTDETAKICREAAEKYNGAVNFIDKQHSGVSDTRNYGLRVARGKYILFLDVDDRLQSGSVERLIEFFDSCGNTVDLVTYPIETVYNGRILQPHFRYKTMSYSGIFDLTLFPFIGQTTMNIVVKNKFNDNIMFDTKMDFSEDQKYCCKILSEKLKIGFCKEAKYIYYRRDTSSSGKRSGSCYIFEQSIAMFEQIFAAYDDVPLAFQGLCVNDFAWKLRSNIFMPYHYDEVAFAHAIERVKALLSRISEGVIYNHPDINFFHKYYWLKLKPNNKVAAFFDKHAFGLTSGEVVLVRSRACEIVVTRIRSDAGRIIFRGFVKSVIFGFSAQPQLFAVIDGFEREQQLYDSAHSYYFCHTRTNDFFAFCCELPQDFINLSFFIKAGGFNYPCKYYFMPRIAFTHDLPRYSIMVGEYNLTYNLHENIFRVSNLDGQTVLLQNTVQIADKNAVKMRKAAIALRKNKTIYLYSDCRGVEKDNGYYLFRQEWQKRDGIIRKYIYDPNQEQYKKLFTKEQLKDVIPFGSKQHKIYFLAAQCVFAAYIEDINVYPFEQSEFVKYADLFPAEITYLQHGILHASLPWKYTPEIICADKIFISTAYEQQLFTQKYHFRQQDVLQEPMPRLHYLDKTVRPQKKFLFAPSWRQYLIGTDIDGVWQPLPELFAESDYLFGINKLLNSPQLQRVLEKNGYTLEFQPHPIFACYRDYFDVKGKNIRFADNSSKAENYAAVITDFSSIIFDFIYLGRRVYSFIPDKIQFRCGMNSYREIETESCAQMTEITLDSDFSELFVDKQQPEFIFYNNHMKGQ